MAAVATGPVELTHPAFQIHARARQAYKSGRAKSIAYRKEQIAQVGYLLKDNEERFKDALKQDLGRPFLETELCVAPGSRPWRDAASISDI